METAPYDSTHDTLTHIRRVQSLLVLACTNLQHRALVHDMSKLSEPEKSCFDACAVKLKTIAYNSPEYHEALKELKPGLDHHYAANSHHPEHYPNRLDGMSLLDLVEMLVDWKAATERMKDGGDIYRSIESNQKRFGYSDGMRDILVKTADELGWTSPSRPITLRQAPSESQQSTLAAN